MTKTYINRSLSLLLGMTIMAGVMVQAFEFPNVFGNRQKPSIALRPPPSSSMETLKQELLQAISGTDNGKSATPPQQAKVLKLVRTLEISSPAPDTILTTDADRIDGTWFLQYTSPSELSDVESDDDKDVWKPINAEEGDAQIPTAAFGGQGAVSAQGITVETANRVVKQSIDTAKGRVKNEISLDWGDVLVAGSFRKSDSVPYRAVVAFDQADITIANVKVSLGWLFDIIAATRGGNKDNGWLETTYIDQDMRIGRGNKGTMFVLTRTADAVTP